MSEKVTVGERSSFSDMDRLKENWFYTFSLNEQRLVSPKRDLQLYVRISPPLERFLCCPFRYLVCIPLASTIVWKCFSYHSSLPAHYTSAITVFCPHITLLALLNFRDSPCILCVTQTLCLILLKLHDRFYIVRDSHMSLFIVRIW